MKDPSKMNPLTTEPSSRPRHIAFVGDYLPRHCGIATFTHDLCEAVAARTGSDCFVGAMNDRLEGYDYPPRVRFEFDEKDLDSYRRAADFLNFNNVEVLCVQHEFGIYGGPAGSHLLALLKEVRMPVVTTLHTVLREPERGAAQGDGGTGAAQRPPGGDGAQGRGDAARNLRRAGAKMDIIPHGIPDIPFMDPSFYKAQFGVEGRHGAADLRPARAGQGHRARHRGAAGNRAAASETWFISCWAPRIRTSSPARARATA